MSGKDKLAHIQPKITSVILAGGLGTRIGGAKGLQVMQGRTLIAWVLDKISRQGNEVLLNMNGAHADYAHFGYRIIADHIPGWAGPLAGLHAALHCAHHDWVACVPCDTPFLPDDLLSRLFAAITADDAEAAVAVANGRRQPAIGLYRKSVLPGLDTYLNSGGRKISDWQSTLRLSEAVFDNADAFININSRDDLIRAGQMTAKQFDRMACTTGAPK